MVSNPAEIHLNICAILSQLGKHDLALHHSMKALILIQDELLELENTKAIEQRQTVLVIALHNIAVEYEYLKEYQSAIHMYSKAKDYATKYLGSSHMFTKKMEGVLSDSAVKIKGIIER